MHFLVFSSEYKVKEFEVLHPTGQTAVLLFWVPWVPLSETQTILKVINKGEGKHTTNFVVNMKLVQNRECGSVGLTLLSQSVLAVREREWVLSFYNIIFWEAVGERLSAVPCHRSVRVVPKAKTCPPSPLPPQFLLYFVKTSQNKTKRIKCEKTSLSYQIPGSLIFNSTLQSL